MCVCVCVGWGGEGENDSVHLNMYIARGPAGREGG